MACKHYPSVVAHCRDQIIHRANMAGLQFRLDDIVCTRESDGTNVVFLRRFFMGYKTNEDGDRILDENGDPIPDFQPTAWLEYRKRHTEVKPLSFGVFQVTPPRLIVRCPWLFFIVRDDRSVNGDL